MTDDRWKAWSTVARRLALGTALVYLAAYLAVALARIDYPFEIEWMEGGSRGHVARLLAGGALYGPPAIAFTAFGYTPLYFHVAAGFARLFGEGFLALRLVSLLASLGCFALVGSFVARETGDRSAGWTAAGLFAATFEVSGAWFDIARVDSLFLLLTLATLHVLRFRATVASGVLAGVLGACAFFTKQTALAVLVPFALCAAVHRSRMWAAFFATLALAVVGGSWLLDAGSDGWFAYYTLDLPANRRIRWSKLAYFWRHDVLAQMPVAAVAAAAFLGAGELSAPAARRLFYACLAIGMLGASLLQRIQWGGYSNTLMPAYAGLAILLGLGATAALRSPRARRHRAAGPLVHGLCLLQLGLLVYDPLAQIPSRSDRRAGERLVETIRALDGDDGEVWVVAHGYLAAVAGGTASAQWMAIADILHGSADPLRETIDREIRAAIRSRKYAAIVIDRDWYADELEAHYELRARAFDDDGVFWPRTGLRTRPEKIYVPKPPEEPGRPESP